jgi:hypothetical protein
MAQSNIDIKILAEFLGKSAFKQADTAVGKLNKNVKSLGASFGIAFGGAALGIAIKKSIRDFADAERETQQLTNTVKNLGLAFAAPEVDAYVEKIGKLYGVTGDQAVPALQALLTATGSVSRSTKIMNVALDLAASRNADVASVASDLANAYVGNTKGLNQYRLGLTKAELAAMSFDEILEKIGSQTLGSADEAAKTLSGQLAILSEVSNQAKERIGGGLVQALGGLGGQNGAGGAAKNIENLSIKLTNAITGFGYLVQEIKIAQPILVAAGLAIGLAWAPWLTAIGVAAVAIGAIGNAMRKSTPQQPMNTGKLFFPSGGDGGYKERAAAEKKAEDAAAARAKKLQAMAKASEKAQKDSLKLAKAKAIFDLKQIQIEAALKGEISKEDEIRLKLMKAIEEENLTNIEKYQKALTAAQEKSAELAKALAAIKATDAGNPFSKWPDYVKTAIELTNTVAQASLQAGIAAGAKLSEALSGARYAAQGAAAAQAAADAAAIAGVYGSATSSATASIAAQTKAAQEAAAAQAKASQEAAAAQLAAITAGSKAQQDAFAAQLKAQQDALTSQSKAQLEALQQRLTEEAAAYKEAAEAAAAAAMAALDTGASAGVSGSLAKIASEAAAQAAAAAAAEAAAAQAAGSVMGGNTTKIEVTVTGDPFTDPNAVAEKVVEIIRSASNRGTVDVAGFE